MTEPKVGVVVESRRQKYWTELVVLLTPEDLRKSKDRGLFLGEFVKVVVQEGGYPRYFIGLVTDAFYAAVANPDYVRDLAQGHMNDEHFQSKDPWIQRQVNFLHHRIILLGTYEEKSEGFFFRPSTRVVPPILHAEVRRFTPDELKKIVAMTIERPETSKPKAEIGLGHLCYGSEPDGVIPTAVKPVDPSLFKGRRTANFGKTGYGKSNENKVIITLVAHAFPDVGFLILDLNGEYALQTSETTSMGLVQAFQRLGLKHRVVFYTGRPREDVARNFEVQVPEWQDYVDIRPIRVNFFEHPDLAVSLAYHRQLMLEGKAPQYLEHVYNDINDIMDTHNRRAYLLAALRKAGLQAPRGCTVIYGDKTYSLDRTADWENLTTEMDQNAKKRQSSKSDTDSGHTRSLYQYASRLAFLKTLHDPNSDHSVFQRIEHDLFQDQGRVVILDLPSIAELADFLVERLMFLLFQKAIELYGKQPANFIVTIEEAHNPLQDKKTIFYRVAKEGRKYGIGMLYSTQSPASIPSEILSQTENFLVKHVSSEEDTTILQKAKVAFAPVAGFLLSEPIIGYSYVYFEPYQPFVVPLKVRLLEEVVAELQERPAVTRAEPNPTSRGVHQMALIDETSRP
ncbi:MAG: DUF87 domain-containing protein [Clostridiales bacterium]|nr:DUF87 domain-containing protein [Clostridiales bacterium]